MAIKNLKAVLSQFVGCDIGEVRLQYHKKAYVTSSIKNVVEQGYLQIVSDDIKYFSIALTKKGKAVCDKWISQDKRF